MLTNILYIGVIPFIGLLKNFIVFVCTLLALFVALRLKKRHNRLKFPNKLPPCNFKITKPVYSCQSYQKIKKRAKFSVIVTKNHRYFIDFPVMFRFYSNAAFRSKIKITYLIPGESIPEEIINQIVVFENKTKEHLYYITDIIVGRIDIEIETTSEFGSPIIEFEVMKNDMCRMLKECKIEINFDKF